MSTHNKTCVASRLELLQSYAVSLHLSKEAYVDCVKKARRLQKEGAPLAGLYIDLANKRSALIFSDEQHIAALTAEIMELCHE